MSRDICNRYQYFSIVYSGAHYAKTFQNSVSYPEEQDNDKDEKRTSSGSS